MTRIRSGKITLINKTTKKCTIKSWSIWTLKIKIIEIIPNISN